jgi:hypothetical protein
MVGRTMTDTRSIRARSSALLLVFGFVLASEHAATPTFSVHAISLQTKHRLTTSATASPETATSSTSTATQYEAPLAAAAQGTTNANEWGYAEAWREFYEDNADRRLRLRNAI